MSEPLALTHNIVFVDVDAVYDSTTSLKEDEFHISSSGWRSAKSLLSKRGYSLVPLAFHATAH